MRRRDETNAHVPRVTFHTQHGVFSLATMSHELIKREYVHRGKILDVSRSRFMSEAKGEVEIEIVHHNGGAGTLPLFEDGTVALVRQWRYPLRRYSLEIAAGRIE